MAHKVQAYEASDGTLHRDKKAATRRDVELMVLKLFGEEHAYRAAEIAEKLIEEREQVIVTLSEYHRHAPAKRVKTKAPSEDAEGTRSSEGTRAPADETDGDMA